MTSSSWGNQDAKKIGIIEKEDKLFHLHFLNIPTMKVDRARDQHQSVKLFGVLIHARIHHAKLIQPFIEEHQERL